MHHNGGVDLRLLLLPLLIPGAGVRLLLLPLLSPGAGVHAGVPNPNPRDAEAAADDAVAADAAAPSAADLAAEGVAPEDGAVKPWTQTVQHGSADVLVQETVSLRA